MREEQVQNAVKFLSHPKVRGFPVVYGRSFLEKQGLTKKEIDEAFQHVPGPPSGTQATTGNQDGQVKTSSNVQAQNTTQTLQPSATAPTKAISPVGTLTVVGQMDMDAVDVVARLRKIASTEIMSVEPVARLRKIASTEIISVEPAKEETKKDRKQTNSTPLSVLPR
ncbi:peroxisomal membrane protein PEX14-like [Pyrus communis]|uniref:peroxisomal membrane protein PEX14-like n=1 Tax=Pyrus communis TaxID=23211 RepID=UPI0035C09103